MRQRRLIAVAALVLGLLAALAPGVARADETCNSPYIARLIKGERVSAKSSFTQKKSKSIWLRYSTTFADHSENRR